MKSGRQFVAACSLAVSVASACNGVNRTAPEGSAGGAGVSLGGGSNAGDAGMSAAAAPASGGSGEDAAVGDSAGAPAAGTSAGGATGGEAGLGGAAGAPPDVAGSGGANNVAGGAGASSMPPGPLLKNGSFELGGLAGWQIVITPESVGKAIFAQWPTGGGPSVDGMYELSFWNGTSAFTGDIHQTVTGLKPGKYELKLSIAYGTGINSAYLYAIGCGPADVQVPIPVATSVPSFAPTSIPLIDVTGSTCTIGLFADMNVGDWLNADNFVFDSLPTP